MPLERFFTTVVILGAALLSACGSGGGGTTSGGGNPPAVPDFTLTVDPPSISLIPGASQSVSFSVGALNGFTGRVDISISGIPAQVTASSTSFVLSAGAQTQVNFSAPTTAASVAATLTVQGTSGALSHNTQVPLSVAQPATASHPPIRTRYLRTDSDYNSNSMQFAPPHFTVYDSTDKRFFVSNPFLNRIDVLDAGQEAEIAQIVVPGAWGIDISPDNKKLYAGTLIGDVYQIDPAQMQVVTRTPTQNIGPNGFTASEAFVLSNGSLALLGAPGGLSVDGYQNFAIWNPGTNSLTVASGCSIQNIGAFAVSGDRTKILAGSIDSDGTVCSFDPVSQQATNGSFGDFLTQINATPDGKRFFVTSEDGTVGVFDATTAAKLGSFQGPLSNTSPPFSLGISGALMSLDGFKLYVVDETSDLVAYDTTTFAETNWIPNYKIVDLQQTIVPGAMDETGLIVGPIGHGVSFVDGSQPQPLPSSPQVGLGFPTPQTGPASGGTTLQVTVGSGTQNLNNFPALATAFIGNVPLVGASTFLPNPNSFPTITGSTPPSSVGTIADFTAVYANNYVAMMPEAFSYGPSIVEVVSNAATAEGGATGAIVGYGFGQAASDVQVTVGGKPAPVTALETNPPIIPYPYLVETLQFTVPPGSPGPADITLTTANGSTTAAGAFHYVPAVKSYPLPGASLQDGIYDPTRKIYYFADKSEIQVLSLTAGGWQTPITLPGVGNNTQLNALSLSPDGSKLAVSDLGDMTIYLVDPDNPAAAHSFALPQTGFDLGTAPTGLAVLDNGTIYFATVDTDGTGDWAFHKLDTNTATFTDFMQQDGGDGDFFIRVLLGSNGRIYSQIEGTVFFVDSANDEMTFATTINSGSGGNDELTLSADGTTLVTNGFFADANLNASNLQAFTDREVWLPVATIGQKLNQNGSALFQPLTSGIAVIDSQTGRLVNNVQLSVQLPAVYDSLVVDGTDDVVVAITTTGVSVVDLTSVSPASPMDAKAARSSIPARLSISAKPSNLGNGFLLHRPTLKRSVETLLH
jgi:WD40 repeat protein